MTRPVSKMLYFLYEGLHFSCIPPHGTIQGTMDSIKCQKQKNRISSSQHLISFIHKSGNVLMTSVQMHTESKVYRAMQFWRYNENLQEMIFQSMPKRISKCPMFTEKIAIKNKTWQKIETYSYTLITPDVVKLQNCTFSHHNSRGHFFSR